MKTKMIAIATSLVLLCGCGNKKMTNQEAEKLIMETYHLPADFDIEIYTADESYRARVQHDTLINKGYATRQRVTLAEIGKPFIVFTDKAAPYLLPLNDNDRQYKIQRLKIGDYTLKEIKGVKTSEDGKLATIEYEMVYNIKEDFKKLVNRDFNKQDISKVTFSKYDDGTWHKEKYFRDF